MEKGSLLILLMFALAANCMKDATYESEEETSDQDANIQQDPVMKEFEDVVVPPLAIYPLNGEYTTEDLQRRPEIKGIPSNVVLTSGPYNVLNGAYQFSGNAGSYIEFPNGKGADGERILDAKKSITLMCWVRPGGKDGPLFNYAKNAWGVHIWIVNGKFFIRVTKANPPHAFYEAIWADQPLQVGKWAHVAATYNFNTGVNSVYVDGLLKKTKNIGTGPQISTNDPEVRMGARVGDGRYFNGAIAQMGVWNVALTPAQILAVRNKALPNPCDSLPCLNGGTCIKTGDGFRCICRPGSTGPTCSQAIPKPKPCDSNPCNNGGTCINSGDGFICTCPPGFTGPTCAQDINECAHYNGGCQDICVNTVGSFYCACSDPEFSVAPDKHHCIAEGVELDCRQNDMTITLPKSLLVGLDREHLRLIDVNCKADENATHYSLTTALTGCKTILRRKGDFWTYSNMVSEIPIKQHQIVTRVRNAMIPFHCFYSKWGIVSSVGLKPMSKKIILSSKGFGKFTITLDLFRKYDFKNPFTQDDFPVMFTIRERIYAEVRVDTEDDRLTILALDCYATPTQDRNSQPRYDIIKDGCSVDNTLKFHPRPDPQSQRFSLEAFQYVSKHPYVFLHCKVQICNATDANSRCAQGCVKRGRRSVKTLPETADNVYPLAQGPLTLNRDKRETEADEALESDQSMRVAKSSAQLPFVVALAVVITVCVVGMSYMAWQKKRGKAARQYKPLYIDDAQT